MVKIYNLYRYRQKYRHIVLTAILIYLHSIILR